MLEDNRRPRPFRPPRPLAHLLAFIVLLAATVLLYQLYSPWNRLLAASQARERRPATPSRKNRSDLALPATNSIEQNHPWGEVRITDPGTDLKVTKVDVVPLQIEAAANEPLRR